MKSRRYWLLRKRTLLEAIDDHLKLLTIGFFVVSFVGLINNEKLAVIWFCLGLMSVFAHAFCMALLYYRKCLQGRVFFGSRIARSIFILREAKRFRLKHNSNYAQP